MDKNKIIQNLKDAGCSENLVQNFFKLDVKEQISLLAKHRINLLDTLHKNQKQIDCLDYLVLNLKQNNIGEYK
ncbi:MAG: hypothetical protein LUB59_01135 [Candidatus Gastranaerophilales bacterium]|nr:hypothetical protein [Candidatus Gastranaerophilales bacterium]